MGTENIDADGTPNCAIIDSGHTRRLDLAIELPESPLQAVMSGEVWEEVYDRLAQLIRQHKTTLVFVNTRRLAERVSRHLGERLGDENIAAHHGSLAREQRLVAEQRLKAGELSALVATASLELGIDIGDVNLVCQLGSTRSIASFLQRVGRSNHTVAGFPKGRIFPLSRDELVECAAIIDSVRRGELDRLELPEQPLDILAQQIVAASAAEEWTEDDALSDGPARLSVSQSGSRASLIPSFACWPKVFPPSAGGVLPTCITTLSTSEFAADAMRAFRRSLPAARFLTPRTMPSYSNRVNS